jgi:UDP-N-acetylmuramyl pentapeptide phosphotransferase/UDP-N-acetylglucosamine-1-phosphate transferase
MTHAATMHHASTVDTHANSHQEEKFPIPAGIGLVILTVAVAVVWLVAGYAGYMMTRPVPLFTY